MVGETVTIPPREREGLEGGNADGEEEEQEEEVKDEVEVEGEAGGRGPR